MTILHGSEREEKVNCQLIVCIIVVLICLRIKNIYVYNSVFSCRDITINSSASTALSATKIAVIKASHGRVVIFGPEILVFSMYRPTCCFWCVFCASQRAQGLRAELTLAQPTGSYDCLIVSGDISNCSYELSVFPLTSAHLSSAQQTVLCENPKNQVRVINDQVRLINYKRAQQLRFVFQWYDIRRQFLRPEFDSHGCWRFYFIHYCLRLTTLTLNCSYY